MRKLAFAILLASASPAFANDIPLERLFSSPALSGPTPREARISPDGHYVALLKNRPEDRERFDLWSIDTATGKERMLVDSKKVGSGGTISEEEKMRRERARIAGTKGITQYGWAPDSRSILMPIDGDLFLATLDGNVRRLTNTAATEMDPKVSETGRYLSFLRDHNLFVMEVVTGREHPLTSDGGGTLSWGTAEFVAQEELGRDTGQWWSPGDRYLAVARVDESPVEIVKRAAIGASGTDLIEQRYPAAGTKNAIVDLYVMSPDGQSKVKVDLGDDPDYYLARVDWAKDGRSLYVQRLSRDQKRLDMLKIDPVTGRGAVLFSETSPTWVNLTDNFKPLMDGFIWSSEKSGYSHLYRWKRGKWRLPEQYRALRASAEFKAPFEMMAYSGATHAISGEGPQTHVWTTILRFLDDKVLGKGHD